MLSRDAIRPKHVLQLWNIQPEDSHDESKSDGREEVQVLGSLVEGWWVLEDREAACAETH